MNYTSEQAANWQKVMDILRSDLATGIYNAWFKPLKLYAVTMDSVVLEAPDQFIIENLRRRYMTMLYTLTGSVFGRKYEITLVLSSDVKDLNQKSGSMLNSRYTFDNFVVGASNALAHAAAVSVAEAPSDGYNPLFLYGGVGLGKTHLMNAIGNYILAQDPRKNVLFISSETFTNEFIDTLAKKRGTSDLRERMRSVDVLMVDDIQFLSKTVATQEEFFHTFNDLHSKGKQIILSSDRPPQEIPTIEERLRSRFQWGLTVDIRKPDFETRVAILRRKCMDEAIPCENDVLEYIAGRVESNIRELEGSLNRLRAKSQLLGGKIDLAFAQETLEAILPDKTPRAVTAKSILDAVAERYAVTAADLISKKRSREFVLPRQVAMYLIREMTPLSTTAIGHELGDRDHTTVMHGCDQVAKTLESDPTFRKNLDELKESIASA